MTTKLAWLGALAVAACGGSSAAPDAARAIDAAQIDALMIDAPSVTTETGDVYELGSGSATGSAVAGASICVDGTTECTTSDDDGGYVLSVAGVPGNVDLAVDFTAANHLGLTIVETDTFANGLAVSGWPASVALLTDADAAAFASAAGFAFPTSGKAYVQARALDATGHGVAGATATLSGQTGTAAVYLDAAGVPDRALTATSASGGFVFGNVTPGPLAITVTAAGLACDKPTLAGTWPATAGTSLTGLAVADSLTTDLETTCE